MCVRVKFWMCLLIAVCFSVSRASAYSAQAYAVLDADTGVLLDGTNENRQMPMASTTKIMTGLLAAESGALQKIVTVSATSAGVEGSSMYLKQGEQLSLQDVLYGLMLCSGNDAAVAIAQHIGGSVKGFVAMMNEKARTLGMKDSSFANPNGLDDERHYSTARDMAKLAQAALKNETLMRIASTRSVTIGGRTMHNHNKLLGYMDNCLGLKTGYTRAAGRTLVSCAEKNGQRLIAVTLQDGNDWADHQTLFDYGFSAYPAKTCAVRGKVLTQAAVSGGVSLHVPLIAGESFCWPVFSGEQLTTELCLDRPLTAPVSVGTVAGVAVFRLNGTEIGRVPLVAGRTVPPRLASALNSLKLELNG